MSNIFEKKQNLKHEINNMYSVLKKIYDKAPCLITICGKIRSGKSVACLSLIKLNKLYKKFNDIFVFSSTIHSNFWTNNGIPKSDQFQTLNQNMLNGLREEQIRTKNKSSILLIIDDCIDSANMYDKSLVSFLTVLRHFNTSVVVITQSITKISPVIRSNSDFMIIYQIIGEKALKTLFDELAMGENKKQFIADFVEKTADYNAIFVDNTVNNLSERIKTFKVNCKAIGIKL